MSLQHLLDELLPREPIFHTATFGRTLADFDRAMSPDYWEVGASGNIYTRAFVLQHLEQNPPVDATTAGWQTSGHALRQLGPDTYLLTYTLQQETRLTRRATVWQHTATGWLILYHQGTVVTQETSLAEPQS